MARLWELIEKARVVDLAHPLHRGMPVSPNHPPFQFALMRRHGDMIRDDGGSASNEMFVMGGHVGTHIDALAHVSHNGKLYGGVEATSVQSQHGFSELGVDSVDPIVCRGVLLDVAATRGVDALDAGYEITVVDLLAAQDRAGVEVRSGDAVLIRSGWARHWNDAEYFAGQRSGAPGPGEEAGRWLAERGVRLAGAETLAFEVINAGRGHAVLPVHRTLLVESGINIIEVLDLSRIAATGVHEFAFVAAPLKIQGGTGSPVRPIALLDV